jgi:hypothetical protein
MARTIIALLLLVSCSSETATFAADGPESGGEDASTVEPAATGGTFVALGTGGAALASGGAPKATGGSAAATGGRSTGGASVTGGVTVTIATGGARATGGATVVATGGAPPECRFITGPPTAPVDNGPCSVASKGRYHCVAGECTSCSHYYEMLDCDGDGTCETKSSNSNCGGCGIVCEAGTCGVDPTLAMYLCRV